MISNHGYKKNDRVFSSAFRRPGVIRGICANETCEYEVECGNCVSEERCYELASMDPKTATGRHNIRIVERLERLIGMLR